MIESNRLPRAFRRGFTLIELLVVIGIISLLFALGVYFYPGVKDRKKVDDGAEQVTLALLTAKQTALRDGVPTGIRLLVDNGVATRLQYIQQPDFYAEGVCVGADNTNKRLFFRGSNFLGDQRGSSGSTEAFAVAAGDYIELFGGGSVHRIAQVVSNTVLQLDATTSSLPTNLPPNASGPSNYRVVRQATPLAGQEIVELPADVGIDFRAFRDNRYEPTKSNNNASIQLSQMQPRVALSASGGVATKGGQAQVFYDIIFAPSGEVLNQTHPAGQVYLWVRDTTKNANGNILAGNPVIIAIQLRTGFIAEHPVAAPDDPFANTRDARSSGI